VASKDEFVTAQQAADILKVSAARVRQMPDEGKLPDPIHLGPKANVWLRADVERLAAYSQSGATFTAVAELLEPAATPLDRIYDGFIDYPSNFRDELLRLHVRAWRGAAPDGERAVVVLGALSDRLDLVTANLCEIAAIVDREILAGRGGQATWFMYYAGAGAGSTRDQGFENVILEVNSPAPRFADRWLLPLFSRPGTRSSSEADSGRGRFDNPHWRSSDIAELERIVGDRVECFPEPAYTETTVNRYLRAGRQTVEVEHDVTFEAQLMGTLARLEAVPMSDPFSRTARLVCPAIASEITTRAESNDPSVRWWDGTTPAHGFKRDPWPTLFAARLVPVQRGRRQEEMLSRYEVDRQWPWNEERIQQERQLLRDLRLWLEDVDEYGDHADTGLAEAVEQATQIVEHWLRVADERALAADVYPTHIPRRFRVAGECDRRYLGSITWKSAPVETRAARLLREHIHGDDLRYGFDVDGQLIIDSPEQEAFVAHWPIVTPENPYPAGSFIIADGAIGSRPVYVEEPDGTLRALPRQPSMIATDWNFGYSGSGPGSLVEAIMRTFAQTEGVDRQHLPYAWLDDQIRHSDEDSLRISVDHLRKRITPAHLR